NNSQKRKKQSGFTLIELLIVVAILGLLAAIGIPQYQGYQAQARINATRALHTEMVKLIGSELAKCTAGASNILDNSAQETACTATTAAMVTAFIANGNSHSDNPYGGTGVANPYVAAASAVNGETSIVAVGDDITITTTWDGGTQTADLTRE